MTLTLDLDGSTLKVTFPVQLPVVLANDWHNRDACLYSNVERAFLEGKHVVMLAHGTRTLREHPKGCMARLDGLSSCAEGTNGLGVVASVNKYRT